MTKELYTEHLHLRKARESDLESVLNNVWSDKRLSETMLWKNTYTIEDAKDRLERTIRLQKDNDAFFICIKDSDEVIGFGVIMGKENGIYEERGICIAVKHQGKGYGKETLMALLKLAFEVHDAKRFIYSSFADNEKSINLALSCGFSFLDSKDMVREKDGMPYICNEYYLNRDDYFSLIEADK